MTLMASLMAVAIVVLVSGTRSTISRTVPCGRESGPQPSEKVVYFLRHGQYWGNVLGTREETETKLWDPALTPLGQKQALAVANDPLMAPALLEGGPWAAQVVIASPLVRAMQTA